MAGKRAREVKLLKLRGPLALVARLRQFGYAIDPYIYRRFPALRPASPTPEERDDEQ